MAFFRRYLQETYKDLDALNASWGTAYTAWDEINADAGGDQFQDQSDRSPAAWADWQAASEQAAHRFYAALDEAAAKAIPGARIGPSGTRDTNGVNGIDWWLLAHDFRSVCLYHGIHDEMYRSFAPQDHLMMNWSYLGDALDEPDALPGPRMARSSSRSCGGTPVYGGRYAQSFSSPTIGPNRGCWPTPRSLARSATVSGG